LPSHLIARVVVTISDDRIIALHGFIGKTQRTPSGDLALALKRKKEFE
jgi:phage-related protein